MQSAAGQVENVESQVVEKGDDQSQEGVGGSGIARSSDLFDTSYKNKVMEDLDALLANLQSTTANISSYQRSNKQQQPSETHPQQYSSERQHNLHSQTQTILPSSEFQYSAQNDSYLNSQLHKDHNSSNVDQGITYQHQEILSSGNYPGGRQDQAQRYTQSQGYPPTDAAAASRGSYHSSGGNSGGSTPPPLPPPPSDILDYNTDLEQPIYEQQTFHIREATPSSVSDGSDHTTPQSTQVRDRGQRMSALSNNLSELDQLLMDLNSAQFMAEVDRKSSNVSEMTVLNGSVSKQPPPVAPKPSSKHVQRTSMDHLLDQLEGVEPQSGRFPADPMYQELSTVTPSQAQHHNGMGNTVYRATSTSSASSTSSYNQPQTASTATKELDELMMSLSEFRLQNKGESAVTYNESAYAKPVKSRTVSSSSPTSPLEPDPAYHQVPEQRQVQRENGLEVIPGDRLEAMLGDLQSDLSRQGVSVKQKGVCAACQKPIVGQVIAALGRTWHVEHFVCAHCDEPLGTRNFYERDSLAYCEKDYHQLFAPRCAYCNGPIVDKCITALDRMWHPEHFFCAQCGRPFGEDDFHEKNGKAYCREDYFQMFAPKCGGCAQPIMENYISALNRQWHPACFVCWDCRATFGAGSFFDYEGLPYCETHYHAKKGSLCASCEKPITGRCITAMFRKFHPEHFVCAFCLKQLNKGTFKEQNDKPYCHPCFVKLFG